MAAEQRLPQGLGGGEVWQSERGVHRMAGPWTATVHAFLQHLDRAGFAGAPKVVGIDDGGREVLTFISGEVLAAGPSWRAGQPGPWPAWARTDEVLVAAGRLLRRFHDAAASFVPPAEAVWRRHPYPRLAAGEIVCHGDVGPHNTIYRDGLPIAFIDWDTARPANPILEFGAALWKYAPLGSDEYFQASDFPTPPPLGHRVSLFARAYGIHDAERVRWALEQATLRRIEDIKYFPVTAAQAAAALRRTAAELEWLGGAVNDLVAELD